MIKDREYQYKARLAFWNFLKEHKDPNENPLIVMPTGTGKSVVIARILEEMLTNYPTTRALMLTHVGELVKQNYSKLLAIAPNLSIGVYSASLKRKDLNKAITFATVQSVYRLLQKDNRALGIINLIVIDEAHLVGDKDSSCYRRVLNILQGLNPRMRVLGLSATPYRMKGGHLLEQENRLFTHVCYDLNQNFVTLVEKGYLAPIRAIATKEHIEVKGLHIKNGDFDLNELYQCTNEMLAPALELSAKAFKEYNRTAMLVFVAGIENSEIASKILNDLGLPTASVNSSHSNSENEKNINDFRQGKLKCLASANQLTTGFDVPQVDLIAMLRPTLSPALHVQSLGRGTRPYPNKDECLVLDFARNSERLGAINDPKLGKKNGLAQMKICPKCNTFNARNAKECSQCQYVFSKASLDKLIEEEKKENEKIKLLDLNTKNTELIKGLKQKAKELKEQYKNECTASERIHIGQVSKCKASVEYTKEGLPLAKLTYQVFDIEDNKNRNVSIWLDFNINHQKALQANRAWWRDNAIDYFKEPPLIVSEAVSRVDELRLPKMLYYKVPNDFMYQRTGNKAYRRYTILNYEY